MIGRLVGRIVHEEPTGLLVIDVAGVGYELLCPVGTLGRAEKEPGGAGPLTILHVHTNFRQDALELFGFCSRDERSAFRALMGVPNVGPRLALSVLNGLPASELAEAIDNEDRARLSKVPGVGKKTAERLVLELRGKLPRTGGPTVSPAPGAESNGAPTAQLVTALTGLGYRAPEAEKAALFVTKSSPSGDLSTLLREALKYLSA